MWSCEPSESALSRGLRQVSPRTSPGSTCKCAGRGRHWAAGGTSLTMALPSTEIPMGAYVHDGGTYFRVWAPTAEAVHVALLAPGTSSPATWQAGATNILAKDENGFCSGYFQGVGYGWQYRYWTTGPAGQGYKRDPRAFELELETYPDCHCRIVKRD